MAIQAIRAIEGKTFFGQENGDLGPANVYWSTSIKPSLTGTIDSVGTAVTGTLTVFTTELKVGDYLQIGSEIKKVVAIASDTALTLESALTVDVTGSTFKKFTTLYLGRTENIEIMDEQTFSPIRFSQGGDLDMDNVETGSQTEIKVMLGESGLSNTELLFNHILSQRNAVSGDYEGYARTLNIGNRHSEYWDEMTIVKLVKGTDSEDWAQTVVFPKCAPIGKIQATYDSTSQRFLETTFKVYPDYTKLIDGKPVLWYSGTYTFDA